MEPESGCRVMNSSHLGMVPRIAAAEDMGASHVWLLALQECCVQKIDRRGSADSGPHKVDLELDVQI